VDSFCSIRGYTVLHTLKARQSNDHSRGIFRYFAAGWNRDSLALEAAGLALPAVEGERRLLLVLTDAHPNDSQGLRNDDGGGLARDYDGELAVRDTAAAVHKLRREGIQVAALVTGREMKDGNAGTIYGLRNFTRVQSMDRLASAAGTLICHEILSN
jgi:nitric oxide reductase activation protein